MEALQVDDAWRAAARQQARDDLLVQHAVQLARHARREEEARVADVEREAAGRADRVVEDLGRLRQHRLLAVVGRHDAAAAVEEALHAREPVLAEDELDAGGPRRDLLREIVDGGTEPAIDDDRIGARAGLGERRQQRLAVVAHRRAPAHGEADILELLADVAEIGVDDLAGENLVAGADDLDPHASGA